MQLKNIVQNTVAQILLIIENRAPVLIQKLQTDLRLHGRTKWTNPQTGSLIRTLEIV